jgi:hypothetical protein
VFWIALLRQRDQHGPAALRWREWVKLRSAWLVTTEAVLWEVLNTLASPKTRVSAASFYRQCHEEMGVQVVPFAAERTRNAIAVYETRPDKGWSLTDCFSFVVMKEQRLTAALTADHHFKQAGFRVLLREDPPN